MPRPKKAVVAYSRTSSLELVDNEREREELEALREGCIQAQVWAGDRALLAGFERGEEIAWESYEDFEAKQLAYLHKIQRSRRGQFGQVGERKIKKYAAGSVWVQVRYMLLVIGAFAFAYVALLNGFWVPKSGNGVDIWENSAERAEKEKAVLAVTVYPGEEHERGPIVWYSPEVLERRAWSRKLAQLALGMFGWWMLRRWVFRPIPKQIVIPKSIKLDMLPE